MRLIKKIGLLTTLIVIILLAAPIQVMAQSASVSAPSTIDPGASGNISISISAAEIGSFQLNISCSSGSVIRFDTVTAGTIPDFAIIANKTSDTSASIAGFMTGSTPITGGTVANISFTAIGAPGSSTNINISGDLFNVVGDDLGATLTGATVQINTPPPQYTLTINENGSGSTSGAGTYDEGTVVNISANPASGWQFDSWSGDTGTISDVNDRTTTITINNDYTITANFSIIIIEGYTLSILTSGNGATSPSVGNYFYGIDEVVNISATPDEGWRFDNWSGGVAQPNSANTTVTMDSDKTVTANFSEVVAGEYILSMEVTGNGTTIPSIGNHTYAEGTVVNINAIPGSGWQFDNWSGGVAQPNSASTTVTMYSDKTVTANFSHIVDEYTLTMAVDGSGTTSPMVGSYTYTEDTIVNINATPGDNWQFDVWTGDVADPNSTVTTITMDSDKTVTANFSQIEDTTPPSISGVSASNISKTGADIIWTTDEPGDSQVDYWSSPGQLTPLDGTLVTEHLVHLADLTPATTYHYNVMSRDWAGNLTTSGEYTFTTLGLPATFITGDWDISLTDIDIGEQVAISFSVANIGDLAGSYNISIEIDGEAEATREGSLGVGASETLSFTTTIEDAGTYEITINGLVLSFSVAEAPSASFSIWAIIVIIILALVILGMVIALLVRKRKQEDSLTTGSLFLGETELETEIEPEPAVEEKAPREAKVYTKREAIEVKESGRSLKVTAPAAEKLKEALLSKTTDPEVGFRLIPSPLKSNQLKMTLDTAKEGDQVMEKDGVKILILSPEVVAALEGMAMDYQETAEGGGFSISELTSDT